MRYFQTEKIVGIVGTLFVHVLAAVLLYFLVLELPEEKVQENGIEVIMGTDVKDLTMSNVNEVPPPAANPASPTPPQPKPVEELMTQNMEESLAILEKEAKKEQPKKAEKTPEQLQKEREEAERIERERREAEAKKQAENSILNAFNKGSKMNKKNDTESGSAAKGSVLGNSNKGAPTGVGLSFSLEGRDVGTGGLTYPAYNVQAEGRVVVDITVTPAGKVLSAKVNAAKSNTSNVSLRRAAEKAALSTYFTAVDGVDNQNGTITYNFELTK